MEQHKITETGVDVEMLSRNEASRLADRIRSGAIQ